MLSLIVAAFVVIDLIILITYTVVMWFTTDPGLAAKETVNVEYPESVEGVSIREREKTLTTIYQLILGTRCVKLSQTTVLTSVTLDLVTYFWVFSMATRLSCRS